MKDIFIPLSGTFRPKGGMTSSALKKATMLADAGHNVNLVTFRYRLDQVQHENALVQDGSLSKKVNFVNFFEFLSNASESLSHGSHDIMMPKDEYLVQRQNSNLYRYFTKSGDLVYTDLHKDAPLPHIMRRYYDHELNVTRLEELDPDYRLKRVRRFIPPSTSPISETYISATGKAYLSIWYRVDGTVRSVIDLSSGNDGEINPEHKNIDNLQSAWLASLIERSFNPVLLVDDPSSFEIVRPSLSYAKESILTIHSNTFNDPDDTRSGINTENNLLLESIDLFNTVVASTQKQVNDLQTLYPYTKFEAIPQAVELPDYHHQTSVSHEESLILFLGRLEQSKQLLEILDEMPIFFEENPKARFEIFGDGSLRAELENRIRSLGLNQHVVLKGRTDYPLRELARATISILPTKYEGFGLSIAESMLVGTPVVAFDCRYGPDDMIDHGINGILVSPQDFRSFTMTLSCLLQDPELISKMRPKATEKIQKLCGIKEIQQSWNNLIGQ
ncbi:glycosyltransferase [Glutamicibacter arilaitensis]|uniref:glycosyltransferase n=1 Tax=Glutamicibacter arilaitensis TaxID=256701 RepID=UPI003FCF4322